MRILTILLAGAILLPAVGAATGEWRLIASWRVPAPNARDVCWGAGEHFTYGLLCDGAPPKLYEFNFAGFTKKNITLNVPPGAWGITSWSWPVDDFYTISNSRNSYIYTVTTAGSVISSFLCPKKHPAGLDEHCAPYGSAYIAIPDENLAISVDRNGSIVESFNGPGKRMTVSDFGNIIVADETTHKIYCGRYGTISLPRPVGVLASWKTGGGGPGEPPPFDRIFVSDAATNYLYFYRAWLLYTREVPASLGRVKALFE